MKEFSKFGEYATQVKEIVDNDHAVFSEQLFQVVVEFARHAPDVYVVFHDDIDKALQEMADSHKNTRPTICFTYIRLYINDTQKSDGLHAIAFFSDGEKDVYVYDPNGWVSNKLNLTYCMKNPKHTYHDKYPVDIVQLPSGTIQFYSAGLQRILECTIQRELPETKLRDQFHGIQMRNCLYPKKGEGYINDHGYCIFYTHWFAMSVLRALVKGHTSFGAYTKSKSSNSTYKVKRLSSPPTLCSIARALAKASTRKKEDYICLQDPYESAKKMITINDYAVKVVPMAYS